MNKKLTVSVVTILCALLGFAGTFDVQVPKGVKVVNADASFCGGTIDEIK